MEHPELEAIDARIGLCPSVAATAIGDFRDRRRIAKAVADVAKVQAAGAPGAAGVEVRAIDPVPATELDPGAVVAVIIRPTDEVFVRVVWIGWTRQERNANGAGDVAGH